MSSWTVSKSHIDVLVNALVQWKVETNLLPEHLTEVGKTLWKENYRSVNYRYSERKRTPAYRFTPTDASLDPYAVLKATGCYGYQSCEHDGWDTSRARRLITALEQTVTESLGEDSVTGPRYSAAPWGYESLAEATVAHIDDLLAVEANSDRLAALAQQDRLAQRASTVRA